MSRVCSMYPGCRFVSGFGKTDGRTTGGRADWPDGRPDGLAEDGRTRGRAADARKSRAAARRPTKRASARERRERGREEREEREREKRCSAGDFLAHRSHFPPASSPSQERGKRPGESQKILACNGMSWQWRRRTRSSCTNSEQRRLGS
jgi:hypothetical protein